MTLRYVPAALGGRVPCQDGFHWALQAVTSCHALEPGTHQRSCIRADLWCVRMTLASGTVVEFGTELAYIDSTLRMVVDVDPRDEVRSRWQPLQLDLSFVA